MLRIYYTNWWQSVTDGETVIEWAVNFRQRFYNGLAIEQKYNDSLPINEAHNYKRESNRSKRYTQIFYENHPPIYFLSKIFLPYWFKYRR